MTEHVGRRPGWDCAVCGRAWPCAPAKAELTAEHRGQQPALVVFLGSCMLAAIDDCVEGDLFERFLGWASHDPIRTVTDKFDTGVAHPARRYNYWLGGKDNFAADRESGDLLAQSYPAARIAARANRAFLGRAVRYVASEAGVRQFLDIGTGLPTADNTHEVAQRVAPSSKIVYVDNDPMVMAHARALLTSTPSGETRYLEEDLRHPAKILSSASSVLDFSQPVGLILVAVVHFLPSQDESLSIVESLLDALAPGSHLIATMATTDLLTPSLRANWDESLRTGRSDVYPRTRDEFAAYFSGLSLVSPGITPVADWRPDPDADEHPTPVEASIFGAVGRK
ncbi:SAM-dependent methyltransferase [Actinoplanes sp. NPDC049596]|uniref:SAM-dependent methyltransferase n=1 Tax=unclassified Actinoplanes TaxID=2626549 RepID=UPI00343F5D43